MWVFYFPKKSESLLALPPRWIPASLTTTTTCSEPSGTTHLYDSTLSASLLELQCFRDSVSPVGSGYTPASDSTDGWQSVGKVSSLKGCRPVPAPWYRSVCWVNVGTLETFRPGPLSQMLEMKKLYFFFFLSRGLSDLQAWSFQGVLF